MKTYMYEDGCFNCVKRFVQKYFYLTIHATTLKHLRLPLYNYLMTHLYFSKYGKHGNEEILYESCSVLTVFIFWHCEQILLLFVFFTHVLFFLFKYILWTFNSNMTCFHTLGTKVSINNIFDFLFKNNALCENWTSPYTVGWPVPVDVSYFKQQTHYKVHPRKIFIVCKINNMPSIK